MTSSKQIPTILRIVPPYQPDPEAPTGVGLATRAFVDVAMHALSNAVSGAAADGPIVRARALLGEAEFLRLATLALEKQCARVLGDDQLIGAAATVGAVAVDAAILDVVGEVIQEIGRAAWAKSRES